MYLFRGRKLLYGFLWISLIALYLVVPIRHLEHYAWNYDEGPQLQAAALASRGHPLYAQTVLNKPPLLVWVLQLGFVVGSTNIATARLAILIMTTIGFVALGMLAELWWGKGAGPAAMAILLMVPEVVVRAAVVMNELPAMSIALVALLAATLYRRTCRNLWLVVSALAYAAVLGVHPLLVFVCVPVALILASPGSKEPFDMVRVAYTLVLFSIIAGGALVAMLLIIDLPGFIQWVYRFNACAARDLGLHQYIGEYAEAHQVLIIEAAGSCVLLFLSARRRFWVGTTVVWLAATLGYFYFLRPLWEHYLILLLYPLVVVVGGGVGMAVRWSIVRWRQRVSRSVWRWAFAGLIFLGLLLLIHQRCNQQLEWPSWTPEHAAVRAYMEKQVGPGEFIVSDAPFLAFASGYSVPPNLTDTSWKRISSGHLHPGEMIAADWEYDVNFIVLDFVKGRFFIFPSFVKSIEAITTAPPVCFGSLCVYSVRSYHPAEATFGEVVRLRGYMPTEETSLCPGDTLDVTLLWESMAPIEEELLVSVHLVDEAGSLAGAHDGPPLMGLAPTKDWPTGIILPDPHLVALDANLPPGKYYITVGVYPQCCPGRLTALDTIGERYTDGRFILAEIELSDCGTR
jgi:hypothetical protein